MKNGKFKHPFGDMKVAMYTDSDVFAGTERHILELSEGLRELGVSVGIACPAKSPLAEMSGERELTVFPIEKSRVMGFGAVPRICGLLRSGEINVIHSHNGKTALAATVAVSWAGKGCSVFTQHFVQPGHLKSGCVQRHAKAIVHRFVNRRIRRFIAVSNAVREAMLLRNDAPPDLIAVIPNGIRECGTPAVLSSGAVRQSLGIPEGSPLAVCVARLETEKDIPSLVDAMRHWVSMNGNVRCVIVGEGSQRSDVESRIRSFDLEKNVKLVGFRRDAMSIVNACDVFVLPSPAEPFGLVVIEAMALSKPVVAICNGGPAEIVVPDKTGILVPAGDPIALANAMRRICESPDEGKRMGNEGRRRMETCFSQSRMANETRAVYRAAFGARDDRMESRDRNYVC